MSLLSFVRTLLIDLDQLIFVFSGLATAVAHEILSLSQTIRPFHPQDGTLYHTFISDTITSLQVFIIYYLLITPLIYQTEQAILQKTNPSLPPRRRALQAARLALGLLPATMLSILFVELAKGYVGRLRPFFASLCLPDVPPSARATLDTILSDAACAASDKGPLHDARRSFPSGHAALGVGGAVYVQLYTLYAARRVDGKAARLIVYAAGWTVMLFGAWVAASRIEDNAHHVGDVAVGALLGVWAAAAHFFFVVGDIERTGVVEGKEE